MTKPKGPQAPNGDLLQEINEKLNTIISTLGQQEKRITAMEELIQQNIEYRKEIDELRVKNNTLEVSVKELQQGNRREEKRKLMKSLELSGIPKSEGESLRNIIGALCKNLNINITENDIKDIYRRKEFNGRPGNIMIKLRDIHLRNKLLQATKGKKIALNDLNLTGQTNGIYLNAPLIPETKKVLYQAKQAKPLKGWFRVWVYRSDVYIRIEENGRAIKVDTLDDLILLVQ